MERDRRLEERLRIHDCLAKEVRLIDQMSMKGAIEQLYRAQFKPERMCIYVTLQSINSIVFSHCICKLSLLLSLLCQIATIESL
jgi:hypothetical protein